MTLPNFTDQTCGQPQGAKYERPVDPLEIETNELQTIAITAI